MQFGFLVCVQFHGERTTDSGTRLPSFNWCVSTVPLNHRLQLTKTSIFPEDILNVRLQTLGVKEHSFDISLSGTRVNWLLYDVGGAVRANEIQL
jgi:hypothetical protein